MSLKLEKNNNLGLAKMVTTQSYYDFGVIHVLDVKKFK